MPNADREHHEIASPRRYRTGVSTHELVVDALSRILFETDMALQLFTESSANELRWIEARLRNVFDEVNGVMLQITD
jgi:hypothetical protein